MRFGVVFGLVGMHDNSQLTNETSDTTKYQEVDSCGNIAVAVVVHCVCSGT